VSEHSRSFRPQVRAAKAEARTALGVDLATATHLFLCIGFIGPHKGFDRAVEAYRRLPGDLRRTAALYVVGAPLEPSPVVDAHVALLRQIASDLPGVTLVLETVSDLEFDLWLQAADTVILPYREISSSGVSARASLFGTPAIVTAVGALPEQAGPSDVVVSGDEEIRDAMAARIAGDDPSCAAIGS
jgi:glycosyltransferase involved in cell wall biosynthesis